MDEGLPTTLVVLGEFGPLDPLSDVVHQHYVDGFAELCVAESYGAHAAARAAGDTLTMRYLLYSRSIALQQLGRYGEAVAAARELLALCVDEDTVWRAKALAIVAEASTREGQPGRALSALAEADWLRGKIPRGTYGHISATMAVALALRSLDLYEQADERLSAPEFRTSDAVHLLATQERAVLSVTWAVSLALMGDPACGQFRATAALGVLLQRLGEEVGNAAMTARGVLFEAYAQMRLGEPELAVARVRSVEASFDHRPELVETQLGRLVLAAAATREGRFAHAREMIEEVVTDARAARRDVWLVTAYEALAEVDTAEHGETPATTIWRDVARNVLHRLWVERDARFEALRDRESVRRLTAEADRMGRVILQDPLTGLGNRLLLQATLESMQRPPAVVFVDVDDFKAVNDRFSHAVGDEVLCRIGHVLRAQCRADDVIVRFGGDEFLVLTSADDDRAETVAHRVHRAIGALDWTDLAPGLAITVSVGVGRPPGEATGPEVGGATGADGDGVDGVLVDGVLVEGVAVAGVAGAPPGSDSAAVVREAVSALDLADAAMLEAKRAGRNRVVSA